ncbi:MBL fold metallo-hydrolase [Streptomyces caniscabiei]|uniref:MBL fold metallo-hydrolase n=1 Tax=Streptomyces caniscabiei TaxID=2746961 RepID=UPI0029B6914C|nr:MBL fold metallo-hydrolase [Streptomyces caniscabiei]MDX2776470.1 MBL fold metallo-hydrolase [Streptomyces caniscabiei]
MQLTKFKHACFTVTKDTKTIVVDPGAFSTDFVVPDNVVATVITHEHADHLDEKQLQAISERNPDMVVVAHESIASKLKRVKTRGVAAGDTIEIGGFILTFTGGEHATIAPHLPPLANLGVHINQTLYYPGDSFTPPADTVKVLALPAAAPWMKASEAIAFLASVRPEQAFPTHDAILSSEGKEIYDRLYEAAANSHGTRYQRISTPIDL